MTRIRLESNQENVTDQADANSSRISTSTPNLVVHREASQENWTPTLPARRPEFWKKRCFGDRRENMTNTTPTNNVVRTTEDGEIPNKRQRLAPENNLHRDTVIKCAPHPGLPESCTNVIQQNISQAESDTYYAKSIFPSRTCQHSSLVNSTCIDQTRSATPHSDTSGKIVL